MGPSDARADESGFLPEFDHTLPRIRDQARINPVISFVICVPSQKSGNEHSVLVQHLLSAGKTGANHRFGRVREDRMGQNKIKLHIEYSEIELRIVVERRLLNRYQVLSDLVLDSPDPEAMSGARFRSTDP